MEVLKPATVPKLLFRIKTCVDPRVGRVTKVSRDNRIIRRRNKTWTH